MRFFRDNKNRGWELEVNVAALKRVRAIAGIDLYKLVEVDDKGEIDASVLQRLASDPILLVDTIYAVCKPAADEKGISDEDFGAAMAGDVIATATDALLDEIVDFFPGARRDALKSILGATRAFEAKMESQIKAKINGGLEREIFLALENANARFMKSQDK